MKIGIDARLYGTKHGGIGRYAQKLIEYLEKIDSKNQYVIFLQKNNFDEYQPQNSNFKKELADFRAYSWQEQFEFPKLLNQFGFDLVHFTHFNVPIFYRGKFLVTIHDLIISHYPDARATTLNPFLYKIKLFFYNLVINHAAKNAEIIIAVSEFTKNDIIKFLKIDSQKIIVTYEGVDLPKEGDGYANEYGDYLLYVGSAYPHKNLEQLLAAFNDLSTIKQELKLVLVGGKNYFYERLENEIKKQGLKDKIILTGYADDKKLVCLYQNAKAYVFPSLIEGFGLPPLEAQSYGVPVISSNTTCLPEILGESAVYFDPKNSSDMVNKIQGVLENEALRKDLIEKGYKNLGRFSWQSCAEKTHQIYAGIIS